MTPRCTISAHTLEETQYYFDRLKSPRPVGVVTANHAHLVPEGVEGFFGRHGYRAAATRSALADCFRNGKEVHLRALRRRFRFRPRCSAASARLGFVGHYMNVFGTLEDMLEGREVLAKLDPQIGSGKRKAS